MNRALSPPGQKTAIYSQVINNERLQALEVRHYGSIHLILSPQLALARSDLL